MLIRAPNLCIMVRRSRQRRKCCCNPGDRAVHGREEDRYGHRVSGESLVCAHAGSSAIGHAIMRNGTTVHIPYITQFADYNQRIVIVNRGGEAAYSMSFMTEDGVTATPGMECRREHCRLCRPLT